MIGKIVGTIWKKMPYAARQKVVRATQTKFTVSVAAVVTNERGEVLLLDHVLRPGSGWGFPGGFVNAGEELETAVQREVREETTLELENIKIIKARTFHRHFEMIFSATAKGEATVNSREIKSLGWFTTDALPENMSASQKAFVRSLLNPK